MELSYELVLKVRPDVETRARRTPLDFSPALSDASGHDVYVKCENLQKTGSFKIRGATAKMASLSSDERRRGVVAASAGNHGQGVAWVARDLGIEATVHVPSVIPQTKLEAIKRFGARVVVAATPGYDRMEAEAMEACERDGKTWISPYDDPWIMAGGGTVACEIFEEIEDVEALLIPAGGGGLAVGMGVVARSVSPRTRVIGVNTSASPGLFLSRRDGRAYLTLDSEPTIAEGLEGGLSARAFELTNRYLDDVVVAKEERLGNAIAHTLAHHHFAIEGSAAVSVAALLDGQIAGHGRRVVVVLSGGNIDYARLKKLVAEN